MVSTISLPPGLALEALRSGKQAAVAIFQARDETSGEAVGMGRRKDCGEGSAFRTLAMNGVLAQAKKHENGGGHQGWV